MDRRQPSRDIHGQSLNVFTRCAVDDHSGKLIVEVERQLHGFLARLRTAGYGEIQGRLPTFRRVSCGSGERRLCVFCGCRVLPMDLPVRLAGLPEQFHCL